MLQRSLLSEGSNWLDILYGKAVNLIEDMVGFLISPSCFTGETKYVAKWPTKDLKLGSTFIFPQ